MGAIFPRPSWAFVKNAADPKQQRDAERRRKRHADRMRDAGRAIVSTPAGRFWLTQILVECGIDDEVSQDAAAAQYALGKRAIGLSILAHVRSASPDVLVQLIREHQVEVGLLEAETVASQTASATTAEDDQ